MPDALGQPRLVVSGTRCREAFNQATLFQAYERRTANVKPDAAGEAGGQLVNRAEQRSAPEAASECEGGSSHLDSHLDSHQGA